MIEILYALSFIALLLSLFIEERKNRMPTYTEEDFKRDVEELLNDSKGG